MNYRWSTLRRWIAVGYLGLLTVGVGLIGLVQAIPRFDEAYGVDGAANFASVAIAMLLAAATLVFLVVAPLTMLARVGFAAALLLPTVAVGAITERVTWSGGMRPTLVLRGSGPNLDDDIPLRPEEVFTPMNAALLEPTPLDAVEYRGRRRDGWVEPAALPDGFPDLPQLPEVWRRDLGEGYAGIAVLGDFVITLDQMDTPRGSRERVLCLDDATGRTRWAVECGDRFSEPLGGVGPRSTPTIAGGRVFAFGAMGRLTAIDLVSGEQLWAVDTLADLNIPPTTWGMASSPLVVGPPLVEREIVVVTLGGPNAVGAPDADRGFQGGNGLAFYDAADGTLLAKSDGDLNPFSPEDFKSGETEANAAGYSSPMLARLDGVDLILNYDGHGLRGHSLKDASVLFAFPWTNGPRVNVAQPLVLPDDRVFIGSSYGTGAAMLHITRGESSRPDDWTIDPLWTTSKMRLKFTSPVYRAGYLYGLDGGILACLDATDGRRVWKRGRYGHGQLLLAGDVLVVQTEEDGSLVGVAADPKRHRELFRQRLFDSVRVWNPPTAANGAFYLRDHREIVKLGGRETLDNTDTASLRDE